MDIRDLVNKIVAVADAASMVIPQAGLIGKGVAIGEKIIDIIDDLGDDIPLDQQAEAQAARAKIAEATKAKVAATTKRMRG
jgi:hypothetical protein